MLEDRLGALESKLDALHDRLADRQAGRTWLERYAFLVTPVITLVVFFLGYGFKDRVDQDLRQKQYELTARQAVQTHLQSLASAGVTREQRIAMAIAIAEFGDLALRPLVRHLRAPGGENRAAAREGLLAVAELEPEATCKALIALVTTHAPSYPVWSHESVAGLLANLRCPGAAQALARLETDHLDRLNPGPDLLTGDIERARAAVRKAREHLE